MAAQAAAGDDRAFEALVDRYKNYVFAIVYPIVRSRSDAEDVAQETFVQLYLSLSRYRDGSFKSWLGRIAVNKAIDMKRKRFEDAAGTAEELEQKGKNPAAKSAEEEMLSRQGGNLRELCRGLPEVYREVMYQHYGLEKSTREIAATQGLPVRTVESRLYRSRQLLKQKWEKGGERP